MAEGWLRHLLGNKSEHKVASAGLKAKGVHPLAIKVMHEAGVDISNHTSDDINKYINDSFDYIITVCDNAAEKCPNFPGLGEKLHIPFDDPDSATGTEEEILNLFRRVRDEICNKMKDWLKTV